jgi:conjugal transfer ATP-binding protein TraC
MAVDLLKTITDTLPLPGKKKVVVTPVLSEAEKIARGMVSLRDVLAPGAMEMDFTYLRIGDTFYRTLFVVGYPRQVGANWLSPLINFGTSLDISMFYYPIGTKAVLKKLRRKITEMEAELITEQQAGKIASPEVELNLEDASALQDELVEGSEKFFQFSLYITIPASSVEELNSITKSVESILGGMLLFTKPATLQMVEGFKATLPTFEDALGVTRNMDTTSLATTFPFTSSELTANEGIMYGLNEHNGSLVVFDRFNLENANMLIFAKSGAGKSYAVKLETMRSLMLGVEVIVVDPENEYKTMAQAIGGSYIPFDFNSPFNINPFDLSQVFEEGENELGLKILNLHGLIKTMFGDLSPTDEAVIDRALVLTYKLKGITPDPDTQRNEPPLLEDLYKVFLGMEEPEAKTLADRLERYVKGSAAGLFDKPSNVNLDNTFTVFGIRDLEDEVRPVAMYVILDYIWTHIRRNRKKRILVIDEAWFLMQQPDSARFLFSLAKRARKYYLGLTTITQDVEDFVATDMGKAIVTNSSLQFLMKQSPSSVDKLQEIFYLSAGEKNLLLSSNVGEGLFFAGSAHVALQVIASPQEHRLITTDPRELDEIAAVDAREKSKIDSLLGVAEKPTDTGSAALEPLQPSSISDQAPITIAGPSGPEEALVEPLIDTLPAETDASMVVAPSDGRVGSPELPLPQPKEQPAGTPLLDTRVAHQILANAPVMDDKALEPVPEPETVKPIPSPAAAPALPTGLIDIFEAEEAKAPAPTPRKSLSVVRGQ